MAGEYWTRYWQKRASRRRFLAGAGVAGAGAATLALVGCGDDDDDGGDLGGLATPTTAAGTTPAVADPFAGAKKGGTYRYVVTGDPPTLDPYGNLSFLTKGFAGYFYSRLFKYKTGKDIPFASVTPTPDAASGYEVTPDGLKFTVKLRPDIKFHNVAPVNGRVMSSDDVKYSWGLATAPTNTNASQLAFVDKVDYPDAKTVVFTLKAPNAAFLDILSDSNLLWIIPNEAATKGFDVAKTAIGSGPWILDSYTPSVGWKSKKNPDWYEKGFPLMDGVDTSIIPEYATRKAQFLAGNTDILGVVAEDLTEVKNAVKDVTLYGELSQLLSFFFFDADPASPWNKDDRVRQAISMSLDRDAITDLGYNVKKLRAAGLTVQDPWNNVIPAGQTRWWLDPKSSKQGDSAKFFKYDPTAAKALLSAAGFPNGFEAPYAYTANRYGAVFNAIAEAQIGFLDAVGIKAKADVQDYSSKYITQTFVGNFKGIAFGYETPFPEAGNYPIRQFTANPLNHGKVNDATLIKLAADQQKELNEEKRREIFHEIQRYHATKMYYPPSQAGAGTGWAAYAAKLKNHEFHTVPYSLATEQFPWYWLA